MRKKWVTLTGISSRIGGGKMRILEEVLNDFVGEGKIDKWAFKDPTRYDALTDKDVTKIEKEIIAASRAKIFAHVKAEREKITNLIEGLKERLAKKEISEKTYKELEAEYKGRIAAIEQRIEREKWRLEAEISRLESDMEKIKGDLEKLETRYKLGEIAEREYERLKAEPERRLKEIEATLSIRRKKLEKS